MTNMTRVIPTPTKTGLVDPNSIQTLNVDSLGNFHHTEENVLSRNARGVDMCRKPV